jgi:hypothetical protein
MDHAVSWGATAENRPKASDSWQLVDKQWAQLERATGGTVDCDGEQCKDN